MSTDVRRLGIFCFYDAQGIVDGYIEYLLMDLRKSLTKLIIAVNGFVNEEGKRTLEKYAQEVIIRENKGFDVGAFRDVILHSVGKNGMQEWDEIVFCNDTFYGPGIPFDNIFHAMEQKEADFWGLNLVEEGMFTHIQSFFLVFRSSIVRAEELFHYFDSSCIRMMLATDTIADVYAAYELGLFRFLIQRGYTFATYTNTQNYDIYAMPYTCMKEFELPLVKKKCFDKNFFHESQMHHVISYIKDKWNYDITNIQQNVFRQYTVNPRIFAETAYYLEEIHAPIPYKTQCMDEKQIIDFIEKNPSIYIYGTGVYARKVWYLFHECISCFQGFMVSDNHKIQEPLLYGKPVVHYSEVEKKHAIIIGCDMIHTEEILLNLKHGENVCVLWKK